MQDAYPMFKAIHAGMVGASISLFLLRALAMLSGSPLGMIRPVRLLSYCIDTALLTAALALLYILQLNPFTTAWLSAKLTLLLAYIILGSLALKRGKTPLGRRIALMLALLCFGSMYGIARTHHPLGWFSDAL